MQTPSPRAEAHKTPWWVWVPPILVAAVVVFAVVVLGLAEGQQSSPEQQGKRGDGIQYHRDVVARYHNVKLGISTHQLRVLLGKPNLPAEKSSSGGPVRVCLRYGTPTPSRVYTFCFDGDKLTSKEWAPR